MQTLTRTSTTEMEVTSIRFERELKDKLKKLAGNQGYQALIRAILWDYVQQNSGQFQPQIHRDAICATMSAIAHHDQRCSLTGRPIHAEEPMLLGLTTAGTLIPLRVDSLV